MTSANNTSRRSAISVQDLLCRNTSDISSNCPPPNTNTEPSTVTISASAVLSSPELSVEHVAHRFINSSPCHHPQNLLHAFPANHPKSQAPSSNPYHIAPPPTNNFEQRSKSIRGPWRIEEDRLLIELVNKYGPRHWSAIATHFPRRTGKQARERWMNQLNPNLKKKNWSPHEDRVILQAHSTLGNKWSAIANLLPGRTDNSVKNRFNSTLKRAMKEQHLTPNNFDINEFVQNLHAKPYVIDQPSTDHFFDPTRDDEIYPTVPAAHNYYGRAAEERGLPLRHHAGLNRNLNALSPDGRANWASHQPHQMHRTMALSARSDGRGYRQLEETTSRHPQHLPSKREFIQDNYSSKRYSTQPQLPHLNSRESSPESFTVTPNGELVRSTMFLPSPSKLGMVATAKLSRDECKLSRRSSERVDYSFPTQKGIKKPLRRSCAF